MFDRESLSRRELLERSALAGLGAAAVAALPRAASAAPPAAQAVRHDRVRNVIFAVADGMSMGTFSLAEQASQMTRGRSMLWSELLADPKCVHGWFEMGSLDSLVTDSAAASSAWATGTRIFNGAVNLLPDGTKLTPIAALVHDTGRRTGLVTTTTITHATPAGFAACQASRGSEDQIAPQYLDVVDVLMGGGREFFLPELRADKVDWVARYRERGYAFWKRRDDVLSADRPARVLGLFGRGHLPFSVDRDHSESIAAAVPTLAEMTRAALEMLSASDRGFLLQVEGGRVDHAAHNNDAGAILFDQLAFDDALRVIFEFARQRDDTLVIVTTDHGNSNPGLNGTGKKYRESTACFERLLKTTASYEAMDRELRSAAGEQPPALDKIRETIRAGTGIELSTDEAEKIALAGAGKPPPELNRQHANFVGVLGQVLGNHTGIGWTGVSHTADLALLTAFGPSAESFRGIFPCTYAYERLTGLLGITHRNPKMTLDQARRFASSAPASLPPHWLNAAL